MGRVYKKKTNRVEISEETIVEAIKEVINKKKSLRSTAIKYGINKSTLYKRIKFLRSSKQIQPNKSQTHDDSGNSSESDSNSLISLKVTNRNKYKNRQIFNDLEELDLKNYLLRSSKINYGLTYLQTRKLAYEYAKRLLRSVPKNWLNNEIAGCEWMKGFMKRHSDLSLRKPENTSLARATAFNETNVKEFFDNYSDVLLRFKFTPERIFNLDETGVTTVIECPKVRFVVFFFENIIDDFIFLSDYCTYRKETSRTSCFTRTW